MKRLFILIAMFAVPAVACADQWVNGYVRRDGTYVQGHWRSSPDGNPYNNYSTQGNINPYTGQRGYRTVQPSMPSINNSYQNPYDDDYLDPLNNGW
ncbi:MAG: hypothetical protein D6694_03550 [Gammaproteobacteria bacterium]|nr:MAG: hypothetical protein D6694_03550 [Gammaproteobacteria bacterium]